MPAPIRIDFVSDVSCPWCAVGLKALEQAIQTTGAEVQIHFQPFELNPQMAPEGEDATEHLVRKYGLTPEQLERNREMIRSRGTPLGFAFGQRRRIHNTFDAHRLLHWAGLEGTDLQHALKHALLRAYHTDGEDVGSHDVLARIATSAGLDAQRARAILASDEFSDEVRAQEQYYIERGIHAVPATIFNERQVVSGGQPVEIFEQVLRQLSGARSS
jgi:predicted DsbA family dithiol-disulfide isomerase